MASRFLFYYFLFFNSRFSLLVNYISIYTLGSSFHILFLKKLNFYYF